jgi:hypothetical protein
MNKIYLDQMKKKFNGDINEIERTCKECNKEFYVMFPEYCEAHHPELILNRKKREAIKNEIEKFKNEIEKLSKEIRLEKDFDKVINKIIKKNKWKEIKRISYFLLLYFPITLTINLIYGTECQIIWNIGGIYMLFLPGITNWLTDKF